MAADKLLMAATDQGLGLVQRLVRNKEDPSTSPEKQVTQQKTTTAKKLQSCERRCANT
jgi:hypothetical protein